MGRESYFVWWAKSSDRVLNSPPPRAGTKVTSSRQMTLEEARKEALSFFDSDWQAWIVELDEEGRILRAPAFEPSEEDVLGLVQKRLS